MAFRRWRRWVPAVVVVFGLAGAGSLIPAHAGVRVTGSQMLPVRQGGCAEQYGWDARPSPRPRRAGNILAGRGIAYAFRNQTVVAEIAEVEVNRATGRVWVKRLVCAHDCGLVVNPEALRHTIECGMLHSLSRALHEEVRFDGEKVTSVDWVSHPTLTHADTPETIDVVLVNGDPNASRPDLPHYGAGETMCKPTIAAVANAIYDATGVRIRRVPFRSDRVLAAIKARSA